MYPMNMNMNRNEEIILDAPNKNNNNNFYEISEFNIQTFRNYHCDYSEMESECFEIYQFNKQFNFNGNKKSRKSSKKIKKNVVNLD